MKALKTPQQNTPLSLSLLLLRWVCQEIKVLLLQYRHHVIASGQGVEEGQEVVELAVVFVVKPGGDGDGVVRLEHIRERAVVHNNRGLQHSPQMGQVLQKKKGH